MALQNNGGLLSSTGLARIPHRPDTVQIVCNVPLSVKQELAGVAHARGRTLSAHLYLVLQHVIRQRIHLEPDEVLEADERLDISHKEQLRLSRIPKKRRKEEEEKRGSKLLAHMISDNLAKDNDGWDD